MKHLFKLGVILLFGLFLSSAYSQPYYLDATNGEDSSQRDGSIGQPWKTIAYLEDQWEDGDAVYFKKGEIWEATTFTLKPSVEVDSYCDLTCTGNEADPIITNMKEFDVGTDFAWPTFPYESNYNGHDIYKVPVCHRINRLLYRDDGETEFEELLRSTTYADLGKATTGGTIQFWYWEADTSACGVGGNDDGYFYFAFDIGENPATLNDTMQFSESPHTLIIRECDNVTIKNVDVQGGYSSAIRIRGSSNVTIQNCTIGLYSRDGIWASEETNGIGCSDLTIKQNGIHSGFNFTYGINTLNNDESSNRGSGDGIRFFREVTNSLIRGNHLTNWGHTGIEFDGADNPLAGVNNNTVHNNFITASDISYGRGIGINGLDGKCANNVFSSNQVKNCLNHVQFNGNNNTFHHNIVSQTRTSSGFLDISGDALGLITHSSNLVCHDNKIDNNLFINNEGVGIFVEENSNTNTEVKDNLIRNNIILNSGYTHPGKYIGLRIHDDANVNNITIQNNSIFDRWTTDPDNDPIVEYRGSDYNVADFNALSPQQNDVIAGNLQVDPKFDLNLPGYNLKHDSPCKDAGTEIEYSNTANDYDGDTFPVGDDPDIGIQEFQLVQLAGSTSGSKPSEKFRLFPNPVTDILHIVSSLDISSLEIHDFNFNEVLKLETAVNEIDVSRLHPGIYFIRINTKDSSIVRAFVKN